MTSVEVTVGVHEGQDAAEQLDAILPVYEEVYAEPPYLEGPRDVAEFLERFARQTQRPGFRMAVARDSDGTPVGFTFGYRLPPDTTWWKNALTPLPDDFTTETGDRTFVIIELAVRAPCRRRGIARRLHDALLAGQPVERATLTTRPEPEAAPAQSAYAAWGYHLIGQSQPWPGAPIYNSLLLDLG
jgi:ribosomal protein S18 acetylase RimI-like enzyme